MTPYTKPKVFRLFLPTKTCIAGEQWFPCADASDAQSKPASSTVKAGFTSDGTEHFL